MSPRAHASSSEEDSSLSGHPLSPPRPFFLPNSRQTDDSADDSDRDLPASPLTTTHSVSPRNSLAASSVRKTPRSHRRRSQLALSAHSADQLDDRVSAPAGPYPEPAYQRPPPSAYSYPFHTHVGSLEPYPGTVSRKSSADSLRVVSRSPRINQLNEAADAEGLPLPHPPFLVDSTPPSNSPLRSSTASASNSSLYRASAAAGIADGILPPIPRNSSATSVVFRSPFLSPASRPSSTWSPPIQSNALPFSAPSNANSFTALPMPPLQKKAMQSTRLREKLKDEDKPWLTRKKTMLERASKWITFACFFIGIAVAAVLVFRGYQSVHVLENRQLCLVLEDNFNGDSLDTTSWSLDVELGGYGNGEFEMTTDSPNNVYLSNGYLYIMPTLTSDTIPGGYSSVMDNSSYALDGCTASNNSVSDLVIKTQYPKRQNTGDGNGNGNTGSGSTDAGTSAFPNPTGTGDGTGNGTFGNGYGGNGTITGGTNSTNSTTPSNSTSSPGTNSCTAISSAQAGTVINPVMSGRINTRGKKSIKYGKVEVRAKLPQGDWLWPAIWMLPDGNDTSTPQGTGLYGAWPASGEIDIVEARGNLPSYGAQGSNYVRSTLRYSPFSSGSAIAVDNNGVTSSLIENLYGWVGTKRGNFADDFHVYAFEWTHSWMRFYMDNRLQAMINLDISSKNTDSYFFNAGGFPAVVMNATSGKYIEVQDPWSTAYGGTAAAPFDQSFYIVIDLAVGGTSGWFPDGIGNKPWYDSSATAMRDFASAQDTWSKTWPSSANSRAFRVDYVKMWQLC